MINYPMNNDPLLDGLASLATDAPPGLIDKIAARWVTAESPIGELFVAFTDHGIAYVRPTGGGAAGAGVGHAADVADDFRVNFGRPVLPADRPPAGLRAALETGRSAGISFDLRGVSGFQADVLDATRTIPRGEVRPYGWIAREIGRPKAVRAVGTALATNPVPLLIPCHRVTRSDGSLGEYIFGPELKKVLLRAEGALG